MEDAGICRITYHAQRSINSKPQMVGFQLQACAFCGRGVALDIGLKCMDTGFLHGQVLNDCAISGKCG